MPLINVNVIWDAEASVWVATSDDVPGLVAEAESFEALKQTVIVRVDELMGQDCQVSFRGPGQ